MAKGCESTAAYTYKASYDTMWRRGEEAKVTSFWERGGLGFTAGNLLRQMSSDGLSRNRTEGGGEIDKEGTFVRRMSDQLSKKFFSRVSEYSWDVTLSKKKTNRIF